MALEKVIPEINEALQYFKLCDDFSTQTAYQHFRNIFQRSKYGLTPCADQVRYGKYISNSGYGRLFPEMWKSLFVYLDKSETCAQGYSNLSEMLSTYISLSDVSSDLCKSLGANGGAQLMFEGLKQIQATNLRGAAVGSQNTGITAMRILQILHNAIRLNSSNLAIYRLNNAVSILKGFLGDHNILQVLSLMILAYVADDAESGILATSEQGVRVLIDMFASAADSVNHYGELGEITFSAIETLDAINHLAVNDDIKCIIEDKGAIPHIIRMLEDDFSPEEQLVAVEALWNLAFIDKIRQSDRIQAVVPTLRKLMTSGHNDLQGMCESALFQIKGFSNDDSPRARTPPPSYQEAISKPDPAHRRQSVQIMLSYQWDSQNRVLRIKDRLLDAGYRVWMDLTNLRGDILGAMAEAVEESGVILVCMTEKYKNSKSCRAEATYAFSQGKKLIPLLMERDYKPDGWLGLLQGMHLYYNFHSETQFDSSMVELTKAIAECTNFTLLDGPIRPTNQEVQGVQIAEADTHDNKHKSANDWSKQDVRSWLQDNDLEELCEQFSKFNGKHLRKLRNKCEKDEEKFEEELKTDYKLNAAHCTQFIVALEDAFPV